MNVQIIAYFVLEAAVWISILWFQRTDDGAIPHKKTGFFCKDPSLSYPYEKGSIPSEWLNITLFMCPLLIWIIDMTRQYLKGPTDLKKRLLRTTLTNVKWFLYYYSTCMLLTIATTLLKNLAGRQRPVFLQLCQPDMGVNCTVGQFINSDYECTNPDATEVMLKEITRSFPSGHASSSVYITVFFMCYLEAKFAKFRVTLSAVYLICLAWMVVCCVSRITENYHHTGDVIGGIVLALPFVVYSSQIQCKGFRSPKQKIE